MVAGELPFERPLLDLELKIRELKAFMAEKGIDLHDEIERLEARARALAEELYRNLGPWERVLVARHPERPTTLEIVEHVFEDFFELHGDRLYGDDPAVVGGIALFEGLPVTVIGHQKGKTTEEQIRRNFGMPHPEGNRKALRLMRQAEKFGRPVVTFVNTPGAYPGKGAEERGQGLAIAENLWAMAGLRVPVVTFVVGEGASGGALALAVADRLYMLEYAWFTVIAPEGAAALLWRDAKEAPRAAAALKLTARDLQDLGVIDAVVPEPLGGAHKDPAAVYGEIRRFLRLALEELLPLSPEELVERRYRRLRSVGRFSSLLSSVDGGEEAEEEGEA
ncbi:MAG: Acetyl-coenzyme A carboxyl transferase alpha chain [Brockia lithotrophica]|uniref:Acetyl-coenzyme A carboxylase carboxyl transferase subunit alpha n=1 Tax=Brockia lithotrophica TaxID=933949 RepID=A0A2T5GAG4_9BACL|nr:MAG: Acetyl-coenzyme A carboxyl transferase alpha chain [Brockia lithotrophica]